MSPEGTNEHLPTHRVVTAHYLSKAPSNLGLHILASNVTRGGAASVYELLHLFPDRWSYEKATFYVTKIPFISIPCPDGCLPNGVTNEGIIAVLIDRLEGFQSGEFANEHNQKALDHLRLALEALAARHNDRVERGVVGQYVK